MSSAASVSARRAESGCRPALPPPCHSFDTPEDEQPSRSASTLPSMEDSPIDNSKLWSAVFKLYDRDNSGFADEGDSVAAMVTMGREREQARRMLARRCDDGRPNLELFQVLLEECVSLNLGDVDISASDWQKELVKHLLGVLKEFERRALARGEFMIAAESRHRVKQLKEVEERRQKEEMVVRQGTEKSGVAEAHVREAVEFNKAWTTNMSEFELRATQIVQELRDRQEATLAEAIETARAEAKARVKPSKAVLDLIKTQERLARSGNYLEAQKIERKVHESLRKEASSMQAAAEEDAAKKVELFKRQQRLEIEGLVARIERGRAEHKGHWAQGAARLMQSHKNMVTDLNLRQNLEANKVTVAIKASMVPVIKGRSASPRSKTSKNAYAGKLAPAPRMRPSKLPPVEGQR